ncbi:MAG: hypothetical protein NUV77_18550, partial [Thermoguttaceae bacterium]|nr:hypothetical protein [Thermoguttaceae bacterium]
DAGGARRNRRPGRGAAGANGKPVPGNAIGPGGMVEADNGEAKVICMVSCEENKEDLPGRSIGSLNAGGNGC